MSYIIITELEAYGRDWWEEKAHKPVDSCRATLVEDFDEAKKLMLAKIKTGAEKLGTLISDGHCSAFTVFSDDNYMECMQMSDSEEDIEYIEDNEDLISFADNFITSLLQGQDLPTDDTQGREAYFCDAEDSLFFAVNDEQCSFHYCGEHFDCNIRNMTNEKNSYYFSYKEAERGYTLSVKLIPIDN